MRHTKIKSHAVNETAWLSIAQSVWSGCSLSQTRFCVVFYALTPKFLYWNRRWHFVFSASKEDLNGRFFIFKRNESRFGRKIPKSALFYPEKLSQSFWRFLVRYAEPVESHYSRLVRHFCFPLYIYKERELMLMKKITFNAPLNHKAYSYEPMKIEVM